jgi:hypothetical protein
MYAFGSGFITDFKAWDKKTGPTMWPCGGKKDAKLLD